jgi:DNA-binding response OmpR family regulator
VVLPAIAGVIFGLVLGAALCQGDSGKPMTTQDKPRLVVVDDEASLRDMLADYLGKHGFDVALAADGRALDACLAEQPADLILLDVNIPGEDGFAIARRLRAVSQVPILMVTAAEEVIDRVVGLEVGADDYVTKPFDLRELRARIRAILRRAGMGSQIVLPAAAAAPADAEPKALTSFGKVMLDVDGRCLIHTDGKQEPLTAMEFDLLYVFSQNPHRVLSRDRLLDLAHHRENEPFDRSIDIRITRIRRKIEIDPAKPQVIKTIRGAGYIYVPPKRPG